VTSPVGSSVPGDTEKGISDEQRALQEQVERPNFEGHEKRECGEHRTVGPHRAWCYDCTEWCYPRPEMACKGCMVPMLQADVEAMVAGINRQSFETMSAQRDELRTVVEGLRAELAKAKAEAGDEHHTMDELYEYRMLYNAHAARGWLAAGLPVVKSWRHSDGELCFGGGWFIDSAQLPPGQVTNHYAAEHWDLFDVPEVELPPEYDGHTPADAAERLRAALRAAGGQEKPNDATPQLANCTTCGATDAECRTVMGQTGAVRSCCARCKMTDTHPAAPVGGQAEPSDAEDVECVTCRAKVGEHCRSLPDPRYTRNPHGARRSASAGVPFDPEMPEAVR